MKFKLKIWRQADAKAKGQFKNYELDNIPEEMSYIEMLDALNTKLIIEGKDPVAFENDCREGICGACGQFINGRPHGPGEQITTCELSVRAFNDGETIVIEPWRVGGFPVIKDLVVDRKAYDKIMEAGGYISVNTGGTPDSNSVPISKEVGLESMDAASCIGCGACAATCKNSSAILFVAAKVSQLAILPQGKVETSKRAKAMIAKMDELGFGSCTNTGACESECPKNISITHIARLNREFLIANVKD